MKRRKEKRGGRAKTGKEREGRKEGREEGKKAQWQGRTMTDSRMAPLRAEVALSVGGITYGYMPLSSSARAVGGEIVGRSNTQSYLLYKDFLSCAPKVNLALIQLAARREGRARWCCCGCCGCKVN